jgi:phospholipid transport system substrate-binding protein
MWAMSGAAGRFGKQREATTLATGLTLLAVALLFPAPVLMAATDPAALQIEELDRALLESMKSGETVAATERYRRLTPTIENVFDLRAMTAFAVGSAWAGFSADQQQAAVAAFERLTIASYAKNFRSFGGERFELDPTVVSRGSDKIVQTQLFPPQKAPVNLLYRMREVTGSWKVIDVYYGAVSQLSIRRSDFAEPIASGGAAGLITHLNALSEDLLK